MRSRNNFMTGHEHSTDRRVRARLAQSFVRFPQRRAHKPLIDVLRSHQNE